MNVHHPDLESFLSALPPETTEDLLPAISKASARSNKTIVVLDDDPTGTQTCYDVNVLTSWAIPLLVDELAKSPSIFFILTNSRSVSEESARALAEEIGYNLVAASKQSGRNVVVISRSDSTLRGHFPAEVDAVAAALNLSDAVRILVPAFIEGGRLTIDDVHYISEYGKLIPVGETPFATDKVFGYSNSNLREWVEEKTKGAVKASEVVSISLHDIRVGGADTVEHKLASCRPRQVCIVNACSHKDLEVLVMALIRAEAAGQQFIYRTSATFVPIRAGLRSGKIYQPPRAGPHSQKGSLVVVGSYVPKTTRQLQHLLRAGRHVALELEVQKLLDADSAYSLSMSDSLDEFISAGRDVVIYTSREVRTAADVEGNLRIHRAISDSLVSIMARMKERPSFVIAKGGITSSDLATKAFGVDKALIVGQIIPGVPVWKLEGRCRFPDLIYVVFPGNVGDDNALTEVFVRLKQHL